ncbi:MAG: hypothetical protein ABI743_13020, partial [bacterium]
TVTPPRGTVQTDAALLSEIPPEAWVIRTTSFEPYRLYRAIGGKRAQDDPRHRATLVDGAGKSGGLADRAYAAFTNRFLVPDAKIGWFPLALDAARSIRASAHPRLVIATGPPASTLVIGGAIARQWLVPLVLDYRDPWTTGYYPLDRPAEVAAREATLEAQLLQEAALITTVSTGFAAKLKQAVQDSVRLRGKLAVIPNGYDPAILARVTPHRFDRPTLVHTGSLYHQRSPEPFFEAWAAVRNTLPHEWGQWDVLFVGNTDPAYPARAQELGLTNCRFAAFVDHVTALSYQAGATALLLFTEGMQTAKVYEYLPARHPILAIGDAPDLDTLLFEWGAGRCFPRDDSADIAQWLLDLLAERANPAGSLTVELKQDLATIQREPLAADLAARCRALLL